MAAINDKFFSDLASGASWAAGVSFQRSNPLPLDKYSVFQSKEKAVEYATTNAVAYPGQVIAVVENGEMIVYVLTEVANEVEEGAEQTYSLDLSRVGTVPVGDDESIEFVNNEIKMKNFGSKYYKYIPKAFDKEGKLIEGTGKYEDTLTEGFIENLTPKVKVKTGGSGYEIAWYAPNVDTTEGLQDTVTGLGQSVEVLDKNIDIVEDKVGDLQDSVYGEGGTAEKPAPGSIADNVNNLVDAVGSEDDSLSEDVDTIWAHVNALHAEDTRLERLINGIEIPVKGVAEGENVLSLSEDGKLSSTIALSYDSTNKKILLRGKNSADLGTIDAAPFIKDGMLKDVAYNAENNTLTFTWNTDADEPQSDTVVLSDIIEPYTAGAGLELSSNEFAVKVDSASENFLSVGADGVKVSGVQSAIEAAVKVVANDLSAHETEASGKFDAIDEALAEKVSSGSIAHTSEGAAEGVTVANGAMSIVVDSYTKAEVYTKSEADNKVAEAKAAIEASVLANKKAIDTEVWGSELVNAWVSSEGKYVPDYAAASRIDALETADAAQDLLIAANDTAVKAAQADATKALDDAAKAQAQADKGVADAAAAQSAADKAQAAANKAQATADTNASNITTINGTLTDHTDKINDHATRISTLETTAAGNAAEIKQLTDTMGTKANQLEVDTISGKVGTLESTATIHGNDIEALKTNKADASNVYTKSEVYTKTEIENYVTQEAYDDTAVRGLVTKAQEAADAAQADADANAAILATLVGTDKDQSIRVIAADEINTLIGAVSDADTITNITSLIEYVNANGADVTKMQTAISGNTAALEKLNGGAEVSGSVLSMINAEIAKLVIPEADGTSIVDTDGVFSVGVVSTDKLEQGKQELVLMGGSASV